MTDLCDTLELAPDHSAVASAVQWLEALGERHGWPARVQFALTLSVDEALTNIVSYAFADASSMPAAPYIRMRHRRDGQAVHIEIRDNGIAFDPTGLPPPAHAASIETADIGGHGVELMRHFLQDLSYAREDGENHLAMTAVLPDTGRPD
jgi:serine/threonine-protein kinase RsbW